MADFLAMGGYALYVWSSFAVTAVLLGGVVAWSAIEARRVERATFARALHARRGERGRTGAPGDAARGDAS